MTPDIPWLEDIPPAECLTLLREAGFGRLAFTPDEYPMILPVNFRLVEDAHRTWIAIRTRADGLIDRAPLPVAFEIDGANPYSKQGWSVVARGNLQHVDSDAAGFAERFDPAPWVEDRDSWLIIEPFTITGRRLHAADVEWVFHARAYL